MTTKLPAQLSRQILKPQPAQPIRPGQRQPALSSMTIQRAMNDPEYMLQLQRALGNRAVNELLATQYAQPDRAGQSGDTRPAPTTRQGGVIQRIIHKGKTFRSKPFENLKISSWFTSLPSDDHRAWALELHRDESEHYTTTTAQAAIDTHITNGDPVPAAAVNPKAERMARVRQYVNTHAPQTTDTSYTKGKVLTEAGRRAYHRHFRKYSRTPAYDKGLRKIKETKPGLFEAQQPILSSQNEWQQIVALTHSAPQTYDFDLGGNKVTLDSLDVKASEERSRKRKAEPVNLGQLFIEQPGGKNSYWKMSDSGTSAMVKEPPHKKLRHLEVERNNKAAFTTYLKDTLVESGEMTPKEAYGDETPYAFQEYKGALSPTSAMASMQTASADKVLQVALKKANTKLGTQVGARALTTAEKIQTALSAFMADQTEVKYKQLVKEIYRLIRAQTRVDQGSDTEMDSDTDY